MPYEPIRLPVVASLWYLQASSIEGDDIIQVQLDPLALNLISGGAKVRNDLRK